MTLPSRNRRKVVAILAILLFFYLALDSVSGDSPTMDEQNHMARGLAFLRTGDPRFSVEHPPLVNLLSTLPLLSIPGIRLPIDHPSWNLEQGWYAFAEQLLWIYNQDVDRMVFLSRMPIVLITIGLALVGFQFARQIWGQDSALPTFLLVLFDPNIIAHGRYSTTDVGGTAFLLLATLALWRMWTRQIWSWRALGISAVTLGLAFSSKHSNLVFVPVFFLITFLPLFNASGIRASIRRASQFLLAGLGSVIILWAIYGFEIGPLDLSIGDFHRHVSPIIMPTYWKGIIQILDISGGGRPNFLLGQVSTDGWWYYFPIAFLSKTPIPTLLLIAISGAILVRSRSLVKPALFLSLPPVAYFLISTQSNLNIGYRHLIPILPFLYLLAGGLASTKNHDSRLAVPWNDLFRWAPFVGALWLITINLSVHPHYISYFNLLAGGPENGHRILIDSNIDWGQDLIRLKEWIEEEKIDKINLSWFGTADPSYYGIKYDPLPGLPRHFDLWWDVPFNPETPEPGVYAISVSNLWELPLQEPRVFGWFRAKEPDSRVGYSIFIYFVE